ncbi:hypothetical protein BJY52DRAFT_861228 [Lactarius psammicola]|nr:hypothetical protein BJY52DRAFT_861228 [Lactarius psammicola]
MQLMVWENGHSKKKKKTMVAGTTAARPTSGRCRHADLLPISSEYCTAPHGVRSQVKYKLHLHTDCARRPALRAQVASPSILCDLWYCIARCVRSRSRSKSSISGREFPTTAAITRTLLFPFWIVPLHTLPSSYIHLPNVPSTAFAVDTFHSSAVPGHMRFFPYRISIFRQLIVHLQTVCDMRVVRAKSRLMKSRISICTA